MRRVRMLLLVLFSLSFAFVAQAAPERRVALVIGNGAYKEAPLKNPVNDARDMAAALRSVGFEVILKENASLREMNEAIDEFWNSLKKGGVGLFFFAGHGLQVGGDNFLVPKDAKLLAEKDVPYECVNAGKVLGRMEDAGNGLNLVFLDACRNNPFGRRFRSSERGLAKMDAPSGSLIAFATAPGDTAMDGEGRNGVYTSHLLRFIRTPGLKVEDVLKRVRIGVAGESAKLGKKQTPWESSSLMGDFYFAGPAGGAGQPVQTAALSPAQKPAPAVQQAGAPAGGGTSDAELQALREELRNQEAAANEAMTKAQQQAAEAEKARLKKQIEEAKRARERVEAEAQAAAAKQQQLAMAGRPSGSPGRTWRDPVTQMEFVWVPGGTYEMGCGPWAGDCRDDEKPVHTVRLDGFWLGKFEVTQGQWKKVMGSNPSSFQKGDNYPVEQVSWDDCKAFIAKLNSRGNGKFRLPTEAEWEYAARSGGKPERFAGGYDVDRVAWYGGNSGPSTNTVGTKAPNGLGLYDMSGNVWEWCEDVYSSSAYSSHSRDNPIYAGGGSFRVFRGGSWEYYTGLARCAYRDVNAPGLRDSYLGFRLARTP